MSRQILIADDAAFMRMLLRDILVPGGYTVAEAVNGRDAVDKYRQLRPDLVTLDIAMPELDGVQALQAIRAFDPGARVLMISAQASDALVRTAFDAGALEFLHKPFQPEQLLAAVKRCMSSVPV
jgi:two-component system chemotaxis response regulator CheY